MNRQEVFANGSVGNATSPAIEVDAADNAEGVACQVVVEAVGATPTATFKWQGSLDGTNWYDLAYITDASATESVATRALTAVGAAVWFASAPNSRRYRYFRCVVSLNTNVTYRAGIYTSD